jgi:hypothetical protein
MSKVDPEIIGKPMRGKCVLAAAIHKRSDC